MKHASRLLAGPGATFQQLQTPIMMRVGQTSYVSVFADEPWNDSGIDVVCGQAFTFCVPTGEEWLDWNKPCGADGYLSRRYMRPWETFRRLPQANWLQLIGTIGKSTTSAITIGSRLLDFLPPFPGRLYLFANDVRCMYWNNRGLIAVRITRTK